MRLRHTHNGRPTSNEQEEVYVQGWSIIEDEVIRLQDKSWSYQLKGNQKVADHYMEAANMHIYLFYYAYFIRNYLDRQGLIDDRCTATQANEKFKIECVEDKILCLSADFDTDYKGTWDKLIEFFGISRQEAGCDTDCCLGIGEMIIEGETDCVSFIIGPCEENDIILTGEYEDCAYDNAHNNNEAEGACS